MCRLYGVLSVVQSDELKGADRGELKTRVDMLLYQAFPRKRDMILWAQLFSKDVGL
jgi:hypothetical protein